jgi:cytochrome c oxidase cbb3-type subunit III
MATNPQNAGKSPEKGSLLVGMAKDRVIAGHKYDGIREYDNPMPGWWVWLFVATILFSVVYVLGLHVFSFINTYEKDLAASLVRLETQRAAYAAAHPTFLVDEESLLALVEDETAVENGSQRYMMYCAACHGERGEGLIGPNLVDDYWVHGGSLDDIFRIVAEGVPAQGMPGWNNAMTSVQIAEVVAFVRTIHGTDPPGARHPEGEVYEPAKR